MIGSVLSLNQINLALQTLTMQILGTQDFSAVRISWPTGGAPNFGISDDVCFISIVEDDDEYNRIRDYEVSGENPGPLQEEWSYTRVWRVSWVIYGPNSFDRARQIRSALFHSDVHDTLQQSNLYWVTETAAPRRVPENHQGQWWERVDFTARFNELVSEVTTVQSIASAQVIIEAETLEYIPNPAPGYQNIVSVDSPQGSTGTGTSESHNETFFGNGSTVAFTLAHTPAPSSSVQAYLNGMRLAYNLDFTVTGNQVTMAVAPKAAAGSSPADVLVFDYSF